MILKKVFCQIQSAIKYLNQLGLMHRDIKPNNLRFTDSYNKKLTSSNGNTIKQIDFGFIEYFSNKKFTRYYCGTVGYMCPFIMNNNKHNPKTYGPEVDLYSISCLLFYMLTGERIFNGKNQEDK